MTQDQLKELENLNERWANECPTQRKMLDCALDIMDLLPDVMEHIKELTAERDAALKACAQKDDSLRAVLEVAEEINDETGHQSKHIEAALSTDCGKDFVPRSELDNANAKCAELRDALLPFNLNMGPRLDSETFEVSVKAIRHAAHVLSSSDLGKGYHADSEWEMVVEALKRIYNFPVHSEPVGGAYNMQDIAQHALAHAEKLMEGK